MLKTAAGGVLQATKRGDGQARKGLQFLEKAHAIQAADGDGFQFEALGGTSLFHAALRPDEKDTIVPASNSRATANAGITWPPVPPPAIRNVTLALRACPAPPFPSWWLRIAGPA